MSFQTGLSGLNAAAKNLDVIGNNIANSNTVGNKSSRAEFAAVVASAIGPSGGGGAGGGIGVEVGAISQQFSQGTINITGNNLDVAVNGGGFFQLKLSDGSPAFTRDGQFKLDATGNLKTNSGANVMGFPTDLAGVPTSTTPQALIIPTGAPIPAKETLIASAEFNLDARALDATQSAAAGKTPAPRSTYGTTITVFDQQGTASPLKLYFVKTDTVPNSWDVFTGLEGIPLAASTYSSIGQVTFDAAGRVTGPVLGAGVGLTIAAGTIASSNPNEASGFMPQAIDVTMDSATQFGTSFAISNITQDGYTAGTLTGVSISEVGVITTRYSNGQSQATGQIALADFRNVQGLQPVGQGNWVETDGSGQPIQGSPGQGNFGTINSGALESSNVDLTAELVAMMTAQRDYQANAQTIKTQDQVLQTLVNLR